jgi:hypothetical protein
LPSLAEICPILVISSDCSRQSSRDKRTVEGTRSPLAFQSASVTSVAERGGADVTAEATACCPSSQSTSTGRFFEPLPSVNGISATQNSPGRIVVIEPLIFRRIAAQECRMISDRYLGGGLVCRLNRDQPMTWSDLIRKRLRQLQLFTRPQFDLTTKQRRISCHVSNLRIQLPIHQV